MIIYEVNIEADRSIAADYEAWLPGHTEELLKCEGFIKATIFKLGGTEREIRDGLCWTIHYFLKDEAALTSYFRDQAPGLRQEAATRFQGRFKATRRVLIPQQEFASLLQPLAGKLEK